MVPEEYKKIAHWAIGFAKQKGCSSVRVSVVVSASNSFEYRNTQLDKLQRNFENKFFIELFVDGRYGSFSTNRFDRNELEHFISEAIASTKYLAPDRFRQLPDSVRYYRSSGDDLDLYDPAYSDLSAEQKIDLIKKTTDEAYGTDTNIISVTSSFDDGESAEYMLDTNGFEAETCDTAFSLSSEVSLRTGGDARSESFWYDSSIYWNDLIKEGISLKALERAKNKIGQKKIKTGRYNMLVDYTVSGRLFSPLITAMFGNSLQQKNSFLLNKSGMKIASDKLTVIDSPHIKRNFGSRLFDGEGVATHTNSIIEKGVLKTYFIDTYNSLKMDVKPTIASPSVIVFENGEGDTDSLARDMFNGIMVTGFNGGNCNQVTGDFSFGVEGFYVDKGEITYPVSEMNITGNMIDLWNNLIAVGNDVRKNSAWKTPSLLFGDCSFTGL
ncbi:MAG: TldD/PmbA family protein [Dysgonomonas sp.]